MAHETVDTLIIGAGQAGLAMSYWLKKVGKPHLILERGCVAERWRSERWDSLTFQFPSWSLELPGFAYSGATPNHFAGRDEVVAFIKAYSRHISAPVREGVAVTRLSNDPAGFVAQTSAGAIVAANVVVATGPYQRPVIPAASAVLSGINQLHTSAYRNPDALPQGGILIVGAGASGAQIAEELVGAGRAVWLSVGSHRRVPRTYRGHDFHHWEFAIGEWDRPVDCRQSGEPPPLLTGVDGGHDMDLRALAAFGVILTGRLDDIRNGVARFKPDLADNLARGDAYFESFVAAVDAHAASRGLDLPASDAVPCSADPACVVNPLRELDLAAAGVSTVLWATGYGLDLRWIDLPVFTTEGVPKHNSGVSAVAGLYFLGLPWLSKRKSTLLSGVGEDTERLAAHIASRDKAI